MFARSLPQFAHPALLLCFVAVPLESRLLAADIGTAFTYQWYLERPAGTPVTDTCDFRFGLWSAVAGGFQAGTSPQTVSAVNVADGLFTTTLDFGSLAINGTARWLEIEVQCPGDVAFVLLVPRVSLAPSPHALALPNFYTRQDATSPAIIGGSSSNQFSFVLDSGVTISGGGTSSQPNVADATFVTISGGRGNRVEQTDGTIGGGEDNVLSILFPGQASHGTIGGGSGNAIDAAAHAVIVGGLGNRVDGGHFSVIGGGSNNVSSSGNATVSGGASNVASGIAATVPGGVLNTADGETSLAAGERAKALHDGTFVWSDSAGTDFASTGINQFLIRATGGVGIGTASPENRLHVFKGTAGAVTAHTNGVLVVENNTDAYVQLLTPAADERGILFGEPAHNAHGAIVYNAGGNPDGLQFRTNGNFTRMVVEASGEVGIGTITPAHPLHMASGAHVTAGGTWTNASSRQRKENFAAVDAREVLDRVANLTVQAWNYRDESPSIRHIGPIAEDFHEQFGLGGDDKSITTIDADGVALAAIQGLYEIVQEKDCEIEDLREHNDRQMEALRVQKDREIMELHSGVSDLRSEVAELRSLVRTMIQSNSKQGVR